VRLRTISPISAQSNGTNTAGIAHDLHYDAASDMGILLTPRLNGQLFAKVTDRLVRIGLVLELKMCGANGGIHVLGNGPG
jgi:hypothetical protein